MNTDSFRQLFRFDPEKALYVGVEREGFVTNQNGIVPLAHKVLEQSLSNDKYGRLGYELSACQVEVRTRPCFVSNIGEELEDAQRTFVSPEGLKVVYMEVAPVDMPLDTYPDPTGRYQRITKDMPKEILSAACRVAGTHVHIGMPDHETALKVYNQLVPKCATLCEKGNGSFGERMALYRVMAPGCVPLMYRNWDHFHEVAVEKGFDKDPRKCWTLIRISVHGTIEFRMFASTPSVERIVGWANLCHEMCKEAMR